MTNRAWVTLATNDSYGLGALVLAHSLRRVGSAYPAVVLITPSVTDAMRERLSAVFEVVTVDVLDSQDAAHLALLKRPELGITFTKIHCWNLTQYEKCVFLDADILVVQNCDELFEREELSAAPDVGWPDCFNSGVFVFTPSADTFSRLIKFAQERGSFDGGDQGLLNSFFSDWSSDNNKRLPFLYNVTSAAFYSYLPALKHFGQNLKIIHFIGPAKPWLQHYNFESQSVDAPEHLKGFLQVWWNLFTSQVHNQLDEAMGNLEQPSESPRDVEDVSDLLPDVEQRLNYATYDPVPDPTSEFPWHHPDKQTEERESLDLHVQEIIDPWDFYRGNIPPIPEQSKMSSENTPDLNEVRRIAWEQTNYPIQGHTNENNNYDHHIHHHKPFNTNNHDNYHESNNTNTDHHFAHQSDNFHVTQNIHNHYVEPIHNRSKDYYNTNQEPQVDHIPKSIYTENNDYTHKSIKTITDIPSVNHHVYCVHMDHQKPTQKLSKKEDNCLNGEVPEKDDVNEDILPRHPYDGYYLRHQVTIDSRGKKLCSHEIPPSSPSPPPESLDEYEDTIIPTENGFYMEAEDETGVAGNLARVQPGVPLQREALDELSRRQGWESGNIDYMGADSFANIWAKISQTLSGGTTKQSSPPKDSPSVVEAQEPVRDLAEKVASVSLDESNDIPVPAREAATAAGNTGEPISESIPNIQVNIPESSPESVLSLECKTSKVSETDEKTETSVPKVTVPDVEQSVDISSTEIPLENVPVVVPQTEISDTSNIPSEPLVSLEPHDTLVEPSSQVHAIDTKNDIPKIDVQQSTEVHVPETAPAVETAPVAEAAPVAETALVAETVSIALAESPDSPKHETELHESKVVPDNLNDKKDESNAATDVTDIETESHESLPEPELSVEPASEPALGPASKPALGPASEPALGPASLPLPTETEKSESKPEITEPLVEQVMAAPKADESELVESSEILSDIPALDPKPVTPVQEKPDTDSVPEIPQQEKSSEITEKSVSDSPPLANTPSTEEVPSVPAAKLEERRRPAAKLQLKPPSAADPLPTPDSEFEDAASLAQSIIASELRTPTVTSASPPADPVSPQPQAQQERLDVKKPDVPTPPVGAVSLSQIGVKPKTKPTTAAQIESSVSENIKSEPPKKKVVKKVVKKDSASSGEAPVPPPRKKEKKPKEK
ncbi:titin isoform X1 [Pieris brassicae]|uniref:titin isoform X1 n=1 Tax=Pieris brassicae TaxID=7116 RepID=UPI001E65F1F0|nr:titin isoform X1 [Pieris brassicae]